jgi:outer membrane protein assembly factor BamE (lipoprotein component of BamABCDE complex)
MKLLTLLAALLALSLAGCGGFGDLVARESSKDEVRARLGAPTETRAASNGEELWEYARGPEGHETHRLRIGADGKVKEVTQLVTEERLMSVVPGKTTRDDVRQLLGRPSEQMMTRVGEAWSWRYRLNGVRGHLVVSFNPDGTARERIVLIDAMNSDSDS